MATRAVKQVKVAKEVKPAKPVKAEKPAKKVVAVKAAKAPVKAAPKKAVPKKAAPAPAPVFVSTSDRKYPTWSGAQKIKIAGISGGGNRAPAKYFDVPSFADPKLQVARDPAFYKAAAQQRLAKLKGAEFAFDDGLTDLERRQRKIAPSFLTGSAKSSVDSSAIRSDISVSADDYFGLGPDRFQLLFISVFGLFTLVGCLSGTIQL